MELELDSECFGEGRVCNVIVGGTNASRGDYNVVSGGEGTRRRNNGLSVIGNSFNLSEIDAPSKQEAGEVGRVGVDGLSLD